MENLNTEPYPPQSTAADFALELELRPMNPDRTRTAIEIPRQLHQAPTEAAQTERNKTESQASNAYVPIIIVTPDRDVPERERYSGSTQPQEIEYPAPSESPLTQPELNPQSSLRLDSKRKQRSRNAALNKLEGNRAHDDDDHDDSDRVRWTQQSY